MSEAGKTWKLIAKKAKEQNESPVQIGTIESKVPLRISFNGLLLGEEFGDKIYINHLMLDENINLDVPSMDRPQQLDPKPLIGHVIPEENYKISGTQKQFLIDFYEYFKQWHNRYIIHIGDLVSIQKLGQNTYIVLQKVQKYVGK